MAARSARCPRQHKSRSLESGPWLTLDAGNRNSRRSVIPRSKPSHVTLTEKGRQRISRTPWRYQLGRIVRSLFSGLLSTAASISR